MTPEDVAVWEALQAQGALPPAKWYYDVKVGQWADPERRPNPEAPKEYADLLAKRIDAVGIAETTTYVVEVKPRLTMSAIGQALAYADLWQRTWPTDRHVQPTIAAGETDPDLEPTARRYGILLLLPKRSAEADQNDDR
jgi:hypothetical protein